MSGQHQISRDEVRKLSPDQVRAALKEGRLADVLAGREPEPPASDDDQADDHETKQLSRADVQAMSAEQVRDALGAGQLAQLLGRQ